MTREEWARSLPNPIHPAQVVERIGAALDYVAKEATAILTSKMIDTPLSLANAQRDAMKLSEGAQQYAQHAPETTWGLDSDVGQQGMKVGLALFDGLDDLRRVAMGAPVAEGMVNPITEAKKVAAGVREAANAIPTIAIIAGLLYLAHKFGDDDA
jgi:hypothetical protein